MARAGVEWPTVAVAALCYGVWLGAVGFAGGLGIWLVVPVLSATLALHSSLQHEVVHGHPFRRRGLNRALVFPALGLVVPYARFEALHLAHHRSASLTDPALDPESGYLDPAVFCRLPAPARAVLEANNTLAGRIVLGPALSLGRFLAGEVRRLAAGERDVRRAWLVHAAAAAPVLALVAVAPGLSLAAYLAAAYGAQSLLMVRIFTEHRAHPRARARSVVIEDRGPLAWLFLNNNLHFVHHAYPALPWYALPALYAKHRAQFLAMNGGYVYSSYGAVARRHLWRRKEPVAHPTTGASHDREPAG